MMKIASALSAFLLVACSMISSPTEPRDEKLTIRFGESATVHGTKIAFTDVSDSRCPATVTCVWEGDAAVRLESGQDAVVLHTSRGAGAQNGMLDRITVTLLDVQPHRTTTDDIPKKDYVIMVKISR